MSIQPLTIAFSIRNAIFTSWLKYLASQLSDGGNLGIHLSLVAMRVDSASHLWIHSWKFSRASGYC
ncbi:hypothetical protein [Rubritalea tangerina]|uniref:hypothetical protein n=1 Tax=Rubritalea tangerina TaxID=430798 RepID=UPI00360FEBB4